MLRSLIDCSRLLLESPWLMLLGLVIVIVPGGLVLLPVLASKLKRATKRVSPHENPCVSKLTRQQKTGSRGALALNSAISRLKFVPFWGPGKRVQ